MATIHSLPTELIHHVLALAFPDHASDPSPTQARSRAALARAAGVHSSWCAPAQDLLTQSLHFDWRNLASREVCGRFADSGPTRGRSRCRALRVAQFDGRVVRRVLERVAGGAVRELTLEEIVGLAEGDVFGSESLSNVESFTLDCGVGHVPQLDNWPTKLVHLSFLRGYGSLPASLLTRSSATLASLTLSEAKDLAALAAAAPRLTSLLHLKLSQLSLTNNSLGPDLHILVDVLTRLPALRTAALDFQVGLKPAQLAGLLARVPPGVRVASLYTMMATPVDDANCPGKTQAAAERAWVASLQACARAAAVGAGTVWTFRMLSPSRVRVLGAGELPTFMCSGGEPGKEWGAFCAALGRKGAVLVPGVDVFGRFDYASLPAEGEGSSDDSDLDSNLYGDSNSDAEVVV